MKIGIDGDVRKYMVPNAQQDVRDLTSDSDGGDDFYSNIFGLSKQEQRDKAERLKIEANAKVEAAKAAQKGAKGDAKIAEALASDKPAKPATPSMSMTTKIGIGAGIVVFLGIGAYLIWGRKKK